MEQKNRQGMHIYLRLMTYEDTESIIAWRNSDRVRNNFIYRELFTVSGHRQWIENMIETGRAVQFIICEKSTDQPIGSVYFRDIDYENKKAEYGIFIGEESAVSKGYGTEAANLALYYAFEHMGLHKVFLRVLSDNLAAIRSYEKAGFEKENYAKEEVCIDGICYDVVFMSIINEKRGAYHMKKISFVIPCYCSEHTIEHVVAEINHTMMTLSDYVYEIILVNDASPDQTFFVIKKICEEHTNIKGINLAKNFGQHAALLAGFHYVTGDIVVCLDDDGQTPAEEVGKLLVKLDEGYDVVYAKYGHKKHSLFRNAGSKLNELMTRVMLKKPKELYVSSYFAAKRFVIEEIIRYDSSFPYVIGLILRATKHIANVDVSHRERESGTSGYTVRKLFALWFNGFISFSIIPLRIATVCGSVSACVGFLYALYTIIKKFFNPAVPIGFSSLMAAVMVIGGMLMLMLGIIGEYIGRIYITLNHSPQYVVREAVGLHEKND